MVGNKYSSYFASTSVTATAADSNADVVFTVPANHDAEIEFLVCANGGSTSNISIQVYHADDDEYYHILRSHSVGGNDTYDVITSTRIYLHAGDKILTYKGSGTFDVSISGRLFYNPGRVV